MSKNKLDFVLLTSSTPKSRAKTYFFGVFGVHWALEGLGNQVVRAPS